MPFFTDIGQNVCHKRIVLPSESNGVSLAAIAIKFLGYTVDYRYLTKDGSVLGKTASSLMRITVYDSDMTEVLYELDDRTLLIEKRFLFSPGNVGRKNFTIAHELAHQIINRSIPEQYALLVQDL